MANDLDINQIIIIAIVVLISIIVLLGIYFLITFIINKKKGKKEDSLFNPSNLVEEDSLVKVMDEKKNVEFNNANKDNSFVQNQQQVNMVQNDAIQNQQQANPFGINMNAPMNGNSNNNPFDIPDQTNNNNKFIK